MSQHKPTQTVAGTDATRRELAHLTLLGDIEKAVRETVRIACETSLASSASDESQDIPPQPPTKKYRSRRARDAITRITMPRRPPNCGASVDTVEVRVFNTGSTGKGQWIDLESLPWLVSYLRDEREHVADPPDDTAVADEPMPGVSIKWDWQSNVWVATLAANARRTNGPQQTVITSDPNDLTPEKWAQGAHLHKMTVDFDNADASQRREATRSFLLHHIQTMLPN